MRSEQKGHCCHFLYTLTSCKSPRQRDVYVYYQHAIVGSGLAGEEGEHDAEVRILQLEPQRAAHLPPQGGLLICVARKRHGNNIQVQVTCKQTSFETRCDNFEHQSQVSLHLWLALMSFE